MSEIKVDQEWRLAGGSVVTAKVLHVATENNVQWVTYRRESSAFGREVTVRTMLASEFAINFKRKADFFELGKVYKYSWSSTTYHIKETYVVSKPNYPEGRLAAVAVVINSNDTRSMTVLNLTSFRDMIEAK